MKQTFNNWLQAGIPWIWLNAGAAAISIVMVVGLILLLAVRGLSHFWPSDVMQANYAPPVQSSTGLSGQSTAEHRVRVADSVLAEDPGRRGT